MNRGQVNEALKPLLWLIGKWRSTSANGKYPTIKPFTYCEEITFKSVGQPMLNYSSVSWHPTEMKPMHLETGFLRIKPGTNELSFLIAHNFGLTSIEEGIIEDNSITLKASQIGRMSFAKDPAVIGLERYYKLNENGTLELVVFMETENIGLTEHLRVCYEKIEVDP